MSSSNAGERIGSNPLMRWMSRWLMGWLVLGALFAMLLPLMLSLTLALSGVFGSDSGESGESGVTSPFGSAPTWQRTVVMQTTQHAVVGGAVAALLGSGLAALMIRGSARWRRLVLGLACLPLVMPSSLWATAWIMLLGRDGVANQWLQLLAPQARLGFSVFDWPVAAAVAGLRWVGPTAALLIPIRRHVRSQTDVARALGVPRRIILIVIELRTMLPALLAIAGCVAALLLQDPVLPGMLLVPTVMTQILAQANTLLDPAGAARLAWMLTAVAWLALGISLLMFLGCRRDQPSASLLLAPEGKIKSKDTGLHHVHGARGLRAVRRCVNAGGILILLSLLILPWSALAMRTSDTGAWEAVRRALIDARPELQYSVPRAVLAAAIATVVATFIAWIGTDRTERTCRTDRTGRTGEGTSQHWMIVLAILPIIAPSLLWALGAMQLRAPSGSGLLMLGWVSRYGALAVMLLAIGFAREDALPVRMGLVLGVPRWHQIWIRLRSRGRMILAIGLITALLTLVDLELTTMLAPPGAATLSVRLYTLIHTAPDAQVSGLALAIALLVSVPWIIGVGIGVDLRPDANQRPLKNGATP